MNKVYFWNKKIDLPGSSTASSKATEIREFQLLRFTINLYITANYLMEIGHKTCQFNFLSFTCSLLVVFRFLDYDI